MKVVSFLWPNKPEQCLGHNLGEGILLMAAICRGRSRIGVAALALFGLSGCGDSTYRTAPVTGTVLCNGKPAVGGAIIFQPIDQPDATGRPAGNPGWPSRGKVGEDGAFSLSYLAPDGRSELTGALLGPHKVVFVAPPTVAPPWDPSHNDLPEEEKARLRAELAAFKTYPELECGTELSIEEVDVVEGENQFEFTLSGQKATRPARPRPGSG